jgi:hypothetical protein
MFFKVIKGVTLPVKYSELTPRERVEVRLAYIDKQGGNCYYCNEPLNGSPSMEVICKNVHTELFPVNFFEYPLHLHHDHISDMTIGAVHCRCNAVLHEYEGE